MAENSSPRDYYADLGVSPYATPAEIRAAYLRLAKEHHPDKKVDNDATEFRKIHEAYEKLRNVEPRPFNIFNPRKSSSSSNVHPNAKFHDTGTEMEEMEFVKSPPSRHSPSGYNMPN
jgi:DnaJ-class molecular chaperone